MAYITLKELKKILPDILDQWIDEDDESWEWIFQEIEQKCHVGKRKHIKGKKWKKKLRDDVDELQYFRHNEYEVKVNGIATRVNELNNKVSKLNDICNAHTVRLDNIGRDITAAKSMAQTAKQRTEIDYSKYSGKSDGKISYNNVLLPDSYYITSKMFKRICEKRGATKDELNALESIFVKYLIKDCASCKHGYSTESTDEPCCECFQHRPELPNWEAKDD